MSLYERRIYWDAALDLFTQNSSVFLFQAHNLKHRIKKMNVFQLQTFLTDVSNIINWLVLSGC